MKKAIRQITEWRNAFEKRLREWLEGLSPKARLTVVLVLFSLFAIGCLVMLGTAIYDFGKGKAEMQLEHIRRLELPTRERQVVPFDYGTERNDCETENWIAHETE